ncbi:DUF5694 domain-containing protein [Asaia krungthepensis]|nr:DUF5694 domain-containing protein [Asaia krungthepensis]
MAVLAASNRPCNAEPYIPAFHPGAMTDRPLGMPGQVLVLGSPHLSTLPQSFHPEMLEPLLTRLAHWHPDAIATETSPGLLCEAMRHELERQADAVAHYCPDPVLAGKAAGLDVIAATRAIDRVLASWPREPNASQRRHLALLFLAAGEPGSALVQWFQLPRNEQVALDGLTQALVSQLNGLASRRNETGLLAARLAAREGLERLWSIDDQRDLVIPMDDKAYGAALQHAWDNPATRVRMDQDKKLYAALDTPDGLLNVYRAYNRPDYGKIAYQSDWGAALKDPSPEGYGRHYVGYWETRNLRMVANMREVLARKPGMRLLVIVGASHKAYDEAYLSQMRDVELVDAETVLQ